MFVVRALLGNVYVCNRQNNFKRPPCTGPGCYQENCKTHVEHFDSVMGVGFDGLNRAKYREFIVYEKQLTYPEFLVQYTLV